MREWWETKTAAWGLVVVGIAGGGVLTYLSPKIGIPVCLVLLIFGLWLLVRAYTKRNTTEADELPNTTQKNGVVVPEKRLIIEIHDSDFGVSGDQGYPVLDSGENKAKWLRLGITFDVEGSVHTETLELVISGKTPILAFGWRPGPAGGGYYYYFQIPDWVKSGERTIQIQAFANGVRWGSHEKLINFPAL